MFIKGFAAWPEWLKGECPYCFGKLGKIESLRRKARKICKCKKCGRIVDERYIVSFYVKRRDS